MAAKEVVNWARENLLRGVPVGEITRALIDAGYSEQQIDEILASATGHQDKVKLIYVAAAGILFVLLFLIVLAFIAYFVFFGF